MHADARARNSDDVTPPNATYRRSGINNGCKALSGTSVAAPVVTGASVLLASTVRPELRRAHLNPASLKQALIETAVRVNEQQDKSKPACPSWKVCADKPRKKAKASIFEQGHGKIDLVAAMEVLKAYQPRASFQPATFDTTDCPFMWPYCAQPIFAGAKPIIANVTVLNGMGVRAAKPMFFVLYVVVFYFVFSFSHFHFLFLCVLLVLTHPPIHPPTHT